MEQELKRIVKNLIEKYKNILVIYMHGSSIEKDLDDYSDIDLVILCEGFPEKNFYVNLVEIKSKKVLISFSFVKYNSNFNPLDYSVTDLIFKLDSLKNSKLLYDKKDFYKKLKESLDISHLEEKQISVVPFYFNVLIDLYYKLKRSTKRKNDHELKLSARHIADKSLKLISCFNKIIVNKNTNFNPKDLTNKPLDYDQYFYLAAGLEDSKNMEDFSEACTKLVENTVLFIKEQDLSNIKDNQFHKLLKKSLLEFS